MLFLLTVLVLFLACIASVKSFTRYQGVARSISLKATNGESRINTAVELENSKVVSNLQLKAGEKCVVCRCWKSAKFPYCDGAHAKHNAATGDNVGPAIISASAYDGIISLHIEESLNNINPAIEYLFPSRYPIIQTRKKRESVKNPTNTSKRIRRYLRD